MMKRMVLVTLCVFVQLGLSAGKTPVEYVNPYIGSISHMLVPTFRTVQRPNAMYRFNAPAGRLTEDRIFALWLQTPGHRDSQVFAVQPYCGEEAGKPGWFSTWDQSHATPYRYDVYLDTYGITFTIAPGEKSAIAAFTFEREGTRSLVFSSKDGSSAVGYVVNEGAIEGTDVFHGRGGCKANVYLHGEFLPVPQSAEKVGNRTIVNFGREVRTVIMRFGISYQSHASAAASLRSEIKGFDVESVAESAKRKWNDALSSIEVEGDDEDEKTVFYTALWRTFERMVDITENGCYLGFDGKVHDAGASPYYTDDWSWDTWRAAHPLMTILRPKEEGDKLQSYVRMAEDNPEHWMPVFPGVAGDRHCMVNRHTSVMFLDAWRKGIRNFDAKRAFEFTEHTEETESLVPWYRGPLTELDRFYKKNGYYPGLREGESETVAGVDTKWERRQSVSVTLGAALDAWAIGEFGRELGISQERLAKYDELAKSYRKLWNPKTSFFHPKDAEGKFIEPFDYRICGGFGARNYYTENNAWTYIWDVQHDLPGLIGLFGSKEVMVAKLDEMLNTDVGSRFKYTADMPDGCTGLMGIFTMANEPAFHIPYLYALAGAPHKTQKFVRKTLECWFRNDLMGICGDEDGGGMSAYAVFSMMGFYPVTPGLPEYRWGSPIFRKVTIHNENGTDFVIEAPDASKDAKYIVSILVDGKPHDVCSPLNHETIVSGGKVRIVMSNRISEK